MKVKVLVTQSRLTLCHPVDWSPPVSCVQEFYRQGYWSGLPFPSPGDLPDPGIEPELRVLYRWCHLGSPRILEWVTYPFSRETS